jgi:glycosyltransferase involved in cell wall biosynthesis
MKLQIVIPALNEEESIRSIITRTLEARKYIMDNAPVQEVKITVVSDGSTDKTVEYARAFEGQVELIVFEKNRGYGAAIMEGWRRSDCDVLSFLDADGTCEPKFFADLCKKMADENADIVLGCRMHGQSKMPPIRRFGNVIFSTILSAFSLKVVRDTASGMRVVKSSALPKLMPLPIGLHFTPAMSARAILSRDVKILEVDMPYHEREGESKLNPIKDGFRFLNVILQTAFLHRPSRPLGILATVMFVFACVLMIHPVLHYLRETRVEEWMIYRLLVSQLIAGAAILTWCASYLGRKAVDVALSNTPAGDKYHGLMGWFFSSALFWLAPILLWGVGLAIVWGALMSYITEGGITVHWSRFVAMSFFGWVGIILVVTWVLDRCLNLLADRLEYLRNQAPGDALTRK